MFMEDDFPVGFHTLKLTVKLTNFGRFYNKKWLFIVTPYIKKIGVVPVVELVETTYNIAPQYITLAN